MNKNNINIQMQQRMMSMILGKTQTNIKVGLTLLLGILPILTLLIIMREPSAQHISGDWYLWGTSKPIVSISYGVMWGIAIGCWVFGLIAVHLLIKFDKQKRVKRDMFVNVSSWAWATIGFMLMYINGMGWWRIALSVVFYIMMAGFSKVFIIMMVVRQQSLKAQQMMNTYQNNNPMNQQPNPSFNQQTMQDMAKKLDEQLKSQGIDIDGLNDKFGDHLSNGNNSKIIDIDSVPNDKVEEKETIIDVQENKDKN